MKKPRICFGHFFLEFLGPNEARRGTPFSVTFFSPLSLLDSSSVVTLTNSRMLQIFSTLTLTLSLFGSGFFWTKDRWCKVPSTYYYKGGGGILLLSSFYCVWHKIRGYFGEIKLVEEKKFEIQKFSEDGEPIYKWTNCPTNYNFP